MANNYVTITIDTLAPNIEIYAPSYTTLDLTNEITIQADETLDEWQEIYVIDSVGSRFDYTFDWESDKFVGIVNFGNLALGTATLYARVRDEVYNLSNLVSFSFVIKQNLTLLILDIQDIARNMVMGNSTPIIVASDTACEINDNARISDSSRRIDVNNRSMDIKASDSDRNLAENNGGM